MKKIKKPKVTKKMKKKEIKKMKSKTKKKKRMKMKISRKDVCFYSFFIFFKKKIKNFLKADIAKSKIKAISQYMKDFNRIISACQKK